MKQSCSGRCCAEIGHDSVCVPHVCQCGALVDAYRIHSCICKRASGKIARHQAINDLFAGALASADMPSTKEPNGLLAADNKRPDGLTLLPWSGGKPLTWDVTVICPMAESYIHISRGTPGAAAELAATRKTDKHASLPNSYNCSNLSLLRLWAQSMPLLFSLFLISVARSAQKLMTIVKLLFYFSASITMQRYNSVLLYESFRTVDDSDK